MKQMKGGKGKVVAQGKMKIKVEVVRSWEPVDLAILYGISRVNGYEIPLDLIISGTNRAYITTPSGKEYEVGLDFYKEYDSKLPIDNGWSVKYGGDRVDKSIVGIYIRGENISFKEKKKIAKKFGGKLSEVYGYYNGLYDETDHIVFIPIKKDLKTREDANKELESFLKKFVKKLEKEQK
ncbi:MAG: hypothetical protein QXW65_02150 [Candidatus Pacearchaeota archaeon]